MRAQYWLKFRASTLPKVRHPHSAAEPYYLQRQEAASLLHEEQLNLKEQEQIAYEDESEFEIWLEDNYTQLEIFNMNEKEKQDIDKEWQESCRECVKTLFEDDYREEEIVLSVEEEDLNKYDNFVLAGV